MTRTSALTLPIILLFLSGCLFSGNCGRAQIGEAGWIDADAYDNLPWPGKRNGYEIEWVTPENESKAPYKVVRKLGPRSAELIATGGQPVQFLIETDDDPMSEAEAYKEVSDLYAGVGLGPPPSRDSVHFVWTKIPCG